MTYKFFPSPSMFYEYFHELSLEKSSLFSVTYHILPFVKVLSRFGIKGGGSLEFISMNL